MYPHKVANILVKHCIRKEIRCYLVVYGDGAGMITIVMITFAITPMALMLSLSAYMYKWEQQHIEAESLAEEYIYTCRMTTYRESHLGDINKISQHQIKKMSDILSSCDDNMLYYKGRCEIDPSKFFCSNSLLDGYLILRDLENVERPVAFTKT